MPFSETTILVTRDGMGDAEKKLQIKLITAYFRLLDENDLLPGVICFYADGVKLVVNGSPIPGAFTLTGIQRCAPGSVQYLLELLWPYGSGGCWDHRGNDGYHRSPIESAKSDHNLSIV